MLWPYRLSANTRYMVASTLRWHTSRTTTIFLGRIERPACVFLVVQPCWTITFDHRSLFGSDQWRSIGKCSRLTQRTWLSVAYYNIVIPIYLLTCSTAVVTYLWSIKKLNTTEIARYAVDGNGHSRSTKVIRCCANRRGIYDFILTLDSNLTSIFNRSWDNTPSLHIHSPPVFQVEQEKDGWE